MNDNTTCLCYFHPKEVVVGVCALCLKERLLILASKQEKEKRKKKIIINLQGKRDHYLREKKKINDDGEDQQEHSRMHYLQKIFALTSFFNRLDIRHSRKETIHDIDVSSTCSYEDSFISIKFENNGVGSWEKGAVGTVPKVSLIKHCDNNMSYKVAVIEHVAKLRMQLRWRKRIGHIFHLIRLKRLSTKGGSNASHVCHVGTKLEGVKVRHGHGHGHGHGWIRTLTKRKTKE